MMRFSSDKELAGLIAVPISFGAFWLAWKIVIYLDPGEPSAGRLLTWILAVVVACAGTGIGLGLGHSIISKIPPRPEPFDPRDYREELRHKTDDVFERELRGLQSMQNRNDEYQQRLAVAEKESQRRQKSRKYR